MNIGTAKNELIIDSEFLEQGHYLALKYYHKNLTVTHMEADRKTGEYKTEYSCEY